MKAQILKIAGVKNEKEFYKKFPTEEAFMKKHGKELKKAQLGAKMAKQMPVNTPELPTLKNTFSSTPGFGATAKAYGKTLGNDVIKGVKGAIEPADISTPSGLAGMIGGIGAGIQQINETDKAIKQNQLYGKVSDVVLQAQATRPERSKNKYVRPEDQLIQNANPLGTGTNYLAAANGAMIPGNPTEIQNTYAPNVMYTDLGYEPLNESNLKQYKKGGKLRKAQLGEAIGAANTIADVSRASGQLGGFLGGQWSGTGGETGGYTKALSSFGLLGGIAGGLLDAPQIKKKQQAQAYLNNNNALMQGQNQIQGFQQANNAYVKDGGHISSYEEGGWVSHNWQPQVIATFGEHKLKDLLKPPHDADMLRAGGHLKYYTPPSAEAMNTGKAEYGSQMAFGGDVRVANGYLKPLSNDVVEAIGLSHDEGGMPMANGNNQIEMEGKETIRKKSYADGGATNDESVTIFGNRFINKDAAEFIGVKAGKKFKTQSKELALDQTKFQKKSLQNFEDANSMEVTDMISQIAQRTKLLNGQAFEAKSNMAKDTLDKLEFYQNETGDLAEANGFEINALDKGILKPIKEDGKAKFGAKMETAQKGKKVTYDPEFETFIDKAMQLEQANSHNKLTKGKDNYRGGGDYYGTNNKTITTREKAKEHYYKNYWPMVKDLPAGLRTRALQMAINTGDPYGELLVAGKEMTIEERRKAIDEARKLGVEGLERNKFIQGSRFRENQEGIQKVIEDYKKDPQTFLDNLDAEQNRYYDSLVEASKFPKSFRDFYSEYTDLAKNVSQQYIPGNQAEAVANTQDPIQPIVQQAPVTQARVAQQAPITQAQQLGRIDDEEIVIENKNVRRQAPAPVPVPEPRYSASSSQFPSPTDEEGNYYMPITQEEQQAPMLKALQSPTYYSEDYEYKGDVKSKTPTGSGNSVGELIKSGLSAAYPFLRSYPMNDLDPSQLNPEYLAASMNQEEPVYAQSYQPLLAQSTSYSFQDQLNEVTAATRAAEKMSSYNPEAAAMIASNAYNAKNKILGEQFRVNQSAQADVINQNRATLNDAQFKNLAIFQDQATKQSQARSNTKATSIEIAKNIAAKYAQNKAENKQMNVASNMFPAFDFNQNGTIYKNPFYAASFAQGMSRNPGMIPGMINEGSLPQSPVPGYEYELSLKKSKARNGAIVKAFKDL
jgi:hypothetical protein